MSPQSGSLHIGVIPDGNRRYARRCGVSHKEAYIESTANILNIIKSAQENNLCEHGHSVEEVSFYLLSEANLDRCQDNLKAIWEALLYEPPLFDERLCPEQIDIRWITTAPSALPDHVGLALENLEQEYVGDGIQVNLLFSYSGKRAVAQACQQLSEESKAVSKQTVAEELPLDNSIDYVIRTGNNPRRECLSGFPIWQAAYAEFYHLEKNFPAVTVDDCRRALAHYCSLRRNKGQ